MKREDLAREPSSVDGNWSRAKIQRSEKTIQLEYDSHIWAYAFRPDGKRALTGAGDHTVRLWNLETGHSLRVLEGHTASVFSLTWSADGRYALSGSGDKTMRLWDVRTGQCLEVFEGHTDHVDSVALSADLRRALSGSFDSTMRLWDLESGRCLHVFEGHTDAIKKLKWSTDQRHALSGSLDKTIRLWDVDTGRLLRVLQIPTEFASLGWGADQRLALAGGLHSLQLWDIETGLCLRNFNVPLAWIFGLAWSDNQRLALSSGSERAVRLWDVKTGQCLRVLEGHAAHVDSIAWSADQRRAFSGDERGTIRTWDLSEFATQTRAPTDLAPTLPVSDLVLDSESKDRVLVGEVISTAALAGQLCREFNVSDHGIDMEIEFKSDKGEATGRKVYLQLKSGDSYLTKRKRDGAEIFRIENARHIRYWMNQAFPVLLVIRNSKGEIRWMEVRDRLKESTDNGKKPVKQIVFEGERFDVMSVRRWRDRVLGSAQ